MPVDPSILMKYDPRPGPPKPRRPEGAFALLLALIGAPLIFVLYLVAQGDAFHARVFVIMAAIGGVLGLAWVFWDGFESITDVFFIWQHPLGSALTDESPPSWLKFVTGLLVLLAWALAVVLLSQTPGVFGGSVAAVRPSPLPLPTNP